MGTRLSVVLCTYNGEAYLREQLDSLLAQTRLPDEIVIGDDASSDGTRTILRGFRQEAERRGIEVRLVERPQNLGFVENFARTLGESRADVLFLCDQDDVWHADKLAEMAGRFEEDPALLLLFSDARLVDAQGQGLGLSAFDVLAMRAHEKAAVHSGKAFEVLLRRCMVTGATAAFRRSLLPSLLPVGEGWIHDEWIAAVAAASGRVGMIERPLIDYRQHGANQVGLRRRTWADRWHELVRDRSEQLRTEVRRMESLREHLARLRPENLQAVLQGIDRKRMHLQQRVRLGVWPRWRRLPVIARQAIQGNYRRYGTGVRSMLRDFLRRE